MSAPFDGRLPGGTLSPGSQSSPASISNLVLGALSSSAFKLIEPHLRSQAYLKGTVLWDAGRQGGRAYFPLSGLISIACTVDDDAAIEVACVGCEAAAGLHTDSALSTRGVAVSAGVFLSLPFTRLAMLASDNGELREMMWSCKEWMLLQAQHNAACNAVHDVEHRLARWLLQVADRSGPTITSTQEDIARLLGVRRTTLTLIANKLQDEGLIACRRGMIMVRDRPRLETTACSCYRKLAQLRTPSTRMPPRQTGNYGVSDAL